MKSSHRGRTHHPTNLDTRTHTCARACIVNATHPSLSEVLCIEGVHVSDREAKHLKTCVCVCMCECARARVWTARMVSCGFIASQLYHPHPHTHTPTHSQVRKLLMPTPIISASHASSSASLMTSFFIKMEMTMCYKWRTRTRVYVHVRVCARVSVCVCARMACVLLRMS